MARPGEPGNEQLVLPGMGGGDSTQMFKTASTVNASFTTMEASLKRIADGQNSLLSRFEAALEKAIGTLNGVTTGKTGSPAGLPTSPRQSYLPAGSAPAGTTYQPGVPPGSTGQSAYNPTTGNFAKYMTSSVALAAFVGQKAGGGYLRQAGPAMGAAAGLDTLSAYAGQFTPYAAAHAGSQMAANSPIAQFSQGLGDLAQANAVAGHFAGQAYTGNLSKAFLGNAAAIAKTNPGMSASDAAQAYSSLLSPQAVNRLGQYYGMSTMKVGGGYTDINSVAKRIVQFQTGRTNPTSAQAQATFRPGMPAYQELASVLGGNAQADLMLNQFYTGGKNIAANSKTTLAEQKSGSQATQNQTQFFQKQDGQFAHMITLQTSIDKTLSHAFGGSNIFGMLSVELSKLSGTILEFVGGMSLLGRMFGGASTTGGVTSIAEGGTGVAGATATTALTGAALPIAATIAGGYGANKVAQHLMSGKHKHSGWQHAVGVGLKSMSGVFGAFNIGDPADSRAISDLEKGNTAAAGNAGVTGLNLAFRDRVAAMFEKNPRLHLTSGFRSNAEQTVLWNNAIKKYGSAQAASKWVAPPGHSMHNKGLAVDIGPSSEFGWLAQNAPKYGLWNYPPEPWHWEPSGARAGLTNMGGDTGTTSAGGATPTSGGTTSLSGASMSAFGPAGTGNMWSTQSSILAGLGVSGGLSSAVSPSGIFSTSTPVGGSAGPAAVGGSVAGTGSSSAAGTRSPVGGPVGAIANPLQWAHALEAHLGIPQNRNNDQVLLAWAQKEGGNWHNTALGNPLGTTERLPGSTSINGVGVQRYTGWTQGIQATVDMLRQSNMSGILAALKGGGDPRATATAIGDSPWLAGGKGLPLGTPTPYGNQIISYLGQSYMGSQVGDPPTLMNTSGNSHMVVHAHFDITVPNATEAEAQKLVTLVVAKLQQISSDTAMAGT